MTAKTQVRTVGDALLDVSLDQVDPDLKLSVADEENVREWHEWMLDRRPNLAPSVGEIEHELLSAEVELYAHRLQADLGYEVDRGKLLRDVLEARNGRSASEEETKPEDVVDLAKAVVRHTHEMKALWEYLHRKGADTKAVAVATVMLAHRNSKTGVFYPGPKLIGRWFSMHPDTAKDGRTWLRENGVIKYAPRSAAPEVRDKRTDIYTFTSEAHRAMGLKVSK